MAPAEDEDELVDWADYSTIGRYAQAPHDEEPDTLRQAPGRDAANSSDIDELSDKLQ
ncbi:hypothetical protein LPJ70_004311, partial [Coemansia sp. RSA 2708]